MQRLSSLQNIGRSVRNLVTRPTAELDAAAAYELWANTYDDTADNGLLHVETLIVSPLIEQAGLRDKFVLDAGCGTGRYLHQIQNAGPRLLAGIDLSPGMLERAQSKMSSGSPTSLNVASIEHLPFRDGMFDFVLSTLVLAHIRDLTPAILELSRVLRRGGELLVSCFHPFGKLLSWDRSFQANDRSGEKSWFSAQYYLHLHSDYFKALLAARMQVLQVHEPVIDESIKPFYERAGRLDIFDRFKKYPLLLIFVACKQ